MGNNENPNLLGESGNMFIFLNLNSGLGNDMCHLLSEISIDLHVGDLDFFRTTTSSFNDDS